MPNPSIYDIINWQQNMQTGGMGGVDYDVTDIIRDPTLAQNLSGQITQGGTGASNISNYLSDLLTKTGSYKGITGEFGSDYSGEQGLGWGIGRERTGLGMDYTMAGEGPSPHTYGGVRPGAQTYGKEMDMGLMIELFGQEGFAGMSEDELSQAITGIYDPQMEKMRQSGKYGTVGFGEGDLKDLISYSQAMQEGMGRVGSISERFDLGGQLASEERGAEREQRKALEAYMPREVASRYGALQSGGGGDMGEAAEAKYLAGLSSAQRRQGRNVRSIYGELEDEMFGGIGKWIQNMTSS